MQFFPNEQLVLLVINLKPSFLLFANLVKI